MNKSPSVPRETVGLRTAALTLNPGYNIRSSHITSKSNSQVDLPRALDSIQLAGFRQSPLYCPHLPKFWPSPACIARLQPCQATDGTTVNDRLDLVNSGLQLADNVLQILPWVIGLMRDDALSEKHLERVLGEMSLTGIADPTPADGTHETKEHLTPRGC